MLTKKGFLIFPYALTARDSEQGKGGKLSKV